MEAAFEPAGLIGVSQPKSVHPIGESGSRSFRRFLGADEQFSLCKTSFQY
jgi:hypothetical protein